MVDLYPSDAESDDTPPSVTLADVHHPMMTTRCKPGFGQIYWIRPKPLVSKSGSNGYIGQNDTRLVERMAGHVTPKSGCHGIANAIRAHGREAFVVEVLESDVPKEMLNQTEIKWIAAKNTWHGGYNCSEGGGVSSMYDPEVKARHKAATKAGHNTPEYIEKARSINQAKAKQPGWSEGCRSRALAQHRDSTKKKAMSDGLKAGWVKRKAAGKTDSISVSMKKKWADPVYQAKYASMLASRTDEQKKSRSDACKAAKARLTKEQRSEAVRKAWLKRRGSV
tara:strand:- start:57 stop:896 length:840 start_codon:yes stop_codon:yes gene_type:complete